MTQPILDSLTDTQAVLSCAGLSAGDVGDSRLIASGLEDDLSIHLHLKLPTYKALVDAGRDPAATENAKLILLAISSYARWYCASMVISRWMYFKQLISDGKTRNDRFDRMDLSKAQANIDQGLGRADSNLAQLLPDLFPVAPGFTFFGLASPGTDPVTDLDT